MRSIFIELRATNSIPEKIKILRLHDSAALRQVLLYAYHPHYNYGITSPYSFLTIKTQGGLNKQELNLLDNMLQKKITPTIAKKEIMKHFYAYSCGLLGAIIDHDLRCGISATTINKAFPKLIPQFKIQLAKTARLDEIKFPCWAQTKYDGVRLIAIVKETIIGVPNIVNLFTRNGKEVNLPKLRYEFENHPEGIYDGELVESDGRMITRTNISGKVNSAMHGGSVVETSFRFMVFDYLTIIEFATGFCNKSYKTRIDRLSSIISSPKYIASTGIYIEIVYGSLVHNIKELNNLYNDIIQSGFEGLILKHENSLYKFGRTKDWIKMKETKTADLLCVDTTEGTGIYEGAIGALRCVGSIEGKHIKVKVSGLSAALRHKRPEWFIGNTIEVKYNCLIQDSETKEWSLFLPRYGCKRFDK